EPVPARAATAPGPARGLDPRQKPTRQYRNRAHDVGSRWAHGAVLHRPRFRDGPFLQAAERAALNDADPGFSRVDLGRLRHPGDGWVRHLVPTAQPSRAVGLVHIRRNGHQSGSFYSSLGRAQATEGLNGFGYTLAELALMDLAVRSTPAGSEGLGFSIMVSVRNLALFGTDWFGSNLLDQYHLSFGSLVVANSATTLITVPLVFLLPRLI